MWKATVRGILARKVRLTLTAVAVLLGVSFVSATYVLTDTVKQSFDAVFRQTLSGVDVAVQHTRPFGDSGDPERMSDSVLDQVRAVPGVARAEGFVHGYAQFVDRGGHSIQTGGAPTLGVSWVDGGPLRLVADGRSRAPRGPGEVAMDEATAHKNGFHVGDRVKVLLRGPVQELRIVGLFGFGNRFDFGAVTFAAFDLRTAQRVFDAPVAFDQVYVQRAPGVSVGALRDRLARDLGPGYEALLADDAALRVGKPVRDFLGFFTDALLGFAAIGVVVGAFIIFNTFTILVTQRTRELGLLRAMGATGHQVVASVLLEALAVGLLASVVGLGLGIALAVGLLELLRQIGLDLPATSTVLLARTVVVTMVVGVVVTVVASLLPALRAARVTPIAAIDAAGARVRAAVRWRAVVGVVVAAVGAWLLVDGLHHADRAIGIVDQVQVVAIGAFVVLVGVVILLATVARPLARVVGWPLRRLGATGVLARANAMRNPRRTAVTASALVIGLALVGLTATFGESAKASVRRDTAAGLRADYVVKSDGFAGFSTDVAARLRTLPQLAAVAPLRFDQAQVSGHVETVGGTDPEALARTVDLGFVSGGIDGLVDGGVAVADDAASRYHLKTGDMVAVDFPRGVRELPVSGIFRNQNFIGIFGQAVPFIVSEGTADVGFGGTPQDTLVLVTTQPGAHNAARPAMERAVVADFPNIKVLSRAEFRAQQQQTVDQFLAVLVAILLLSEIIAILGIVNTLALSVFERTRELGLLRVVGMSRRQVRTMVRGESVVIAVIGGAVGVAVGVLWGWVFTRALRSEGVTVFRLPALQVVLFLVGSMLAGVVAAVLPAWRASRLDVLEAIATE